MMMPEEVKPSLEEIVLIGEYTTPEGPSGDDHFIYVLDSFGNQLTFELSESDVLSWLREIGTKAGADTSLRLCDRTDFSSRVIYPAELQERPLFEYKKIGKSLLAKIVSFGASEYKRSYSLDVKAYLDANGSNVED